MTSVWDPVIELRSTFKQVNTDFARTLVAGSRNASGQVVTSKTALGLTAYFASVRNISDDIAKTPMFMVEDVKPGVTRAIHRHDALTLVSDKPNPMMTSMDFWSTMIGHMLAWKGGFAEIVPDSLGNPLEMWPMDPNTVRVIWDIPHKTLIYEIHSHGQFFRLRADQVFHLNGFGFDGFTQFVMSNTFQVAIGRALATQEHSAAFFGNGATLNAVLEAPPTLDEEGMKLLQKTFRQRHAGAGQAYQTPVLTDGVQYKEITNDPKKSQLIEAMHLGKEEMASIFRMPLNKIQHDIRSTFNNVAEQNKFYQQDTLSAHTRRITQECKAKLLPRTEDKNKRFRYDFSDLLKADPVANADVLLKKFQMGGLTINEQLQEDNKPGIGAAGNVRFVMANLVPLERAINPPEPSSEPVPDEPQPEPDTEAAADIEDAVERGIVKALPEITSNLATARKDPAIKAILHQFQQDFRRFQHIAEKKAMPAIADEKLEEWAAGYFPNQEKYIAESIEASCAVLVAVCGSIMEPSELAASMASEYTKESCIRILAGSKNENVDVLDRFATIMAVRVVTMAGVDLSVLDISDPLG